MSSLTCRSGTRGREQFPWREMMGVMACQGRLAAGDWSRRFWGCESDLLETDRAGLILVLGFEDRGRALRESPPRTSLKAEGACLASMSLCRSRCWAQQLPWLHRARSKESGSWCAVRWCSGVAEVVYQD